MCSSDLPTPAEPLPPPLPQSSPTARGASPAAAAQRPTPGRPSDRARFATEAARAEYAAAARTFRQTLRQALIDVDNALSARAQYQLEIDALEATLQAATRSEHLGETLFRAGSVPQQTWIADQASRRASAAALVNTRLLALQSYSTLCLALGGGSEN